MSPLDRSVKPISYALVRRLLTQSAKEGVPPEVLRWAVKRLACDLYEDYASFDQKWQISIEWWHGAIRLFRIPDHLVRYDVKLSSAAQFQKGVGRDPTEALRNSLSVRSEMHHFRLNQHFPKRIREVQLEMYDSTMYILVHFRNGHKIRKPEAETSTTEFLALCAMLYDLPPKEPEK